MSELEEASLRVELQKQREYTSELQKSLLHEQELNVQLCRKIEGMRNSTTALLDTCEQAQENISNRLIREMTRLQNEQVEMCQVAEVQEARLIQVLEERLDTLKMEKCTLENTLEQEQERIVNRLQRQMEDLRHSAAASGDEDENISYSMRQYQQSSLPASPPIMDYTGMEREADLSRQITKLREDYQNLLVENLRLQGKLRRRSIDACGGSPLIEPIPSPNLSNGSFTLRRSDNSYNVSNKHGSINDLHIRHSEMEHNFMELADVLTYFPPIKFACAYGSAVLKQHGYDNTNSMVDFIFVVKDTSAWHNDNLLMNPSHYSGKPYKVIQDTAAGIYFIPDIKVGPSLRIKYGVIGVEKFISDLLNWDTLYIAGRLHKPVIPLINGTVSITGSMEANHGHAANVAMLMLPKRFNLMDFLHEIVRISYIGDFRVGLAEDPKKVERIVKGQQGLLSDIYRKYLTRDAVGIHGDVYEQSDDPIYHLDRLTKLPINLLKNLSIHPYVLAKSPLKIKNNLESGIRSIVWRPAVGQAAKGILTAGLSKSIQYAMSKLGKRFR